MTELDHDIVNFLLLFLNDPALEGRPVSGTELRRAVRSQHQRVALTDGDLNRLIGFLEREKFITGTTDTIDGQLWALTPKGRIRAQTA